MQVDVPDPRLREDLGCPQKLTQRFGEGHGKIVMRRISELFASDRLGDFCVLRQARARELDGSRKGQISLSLLPTLQMIVVPVKTSQPPTATSDWMGATHINIVDVSELREIPTPDV